MMLTFLLYWGFLGLLGFAGIQRETAKWKLLRPRLDKAVGENQLPELDKFVEDRTFLQLCKGMLISSFMGPFTLAILFILQLTRYKLAEALKESA